MYQDILFYTVSHCKYKLQAKDEQFVIEHSIQMAKIWDNYQKIIEFIFVAMDMQQLYYSETLFIWTPCDLDVFTTLDFLDLRVKHNIHVLVQFL